MAGNARAFSRCAQPIAIRELTNSDYLGADFNRRWLELAQRASEPNPFCETWFLLPSLEAFAKPGSDIILLSAFSGELLVGLMPVDRTLDYYGHVLPHVAAWLHDNTFYGAPLVRRGYESEFWIALLEHLDAKPGGSFFFHCPSLDENGPLSKALANILKEAPRASAVVMRQERAMLHSTLSRDDYLVRSLSKKHAKELRRQRRRLAELGALTTDHRTGDEALDERIEEFIAFEGAGWKGKAGSSLGSDPAKAAFFSEVLRGAARFGRLERLALRLDGKAVAMLVRFVTAPGCYSFKTAFDERHAAHSPGMQLQIDNLSVLERSEIEWSDSCAAQGHPMIDRLWTERRQLVSRNIAIGGPLRRSAGRALMAWETRKRSAK